MRALIIGDVHLDDRGVSSRTDDWKTTMLGKLEFCIEEANRQNVDCVVQLGDFLHRKQANLTSHGLVHRAIEILESADMPVRMLVGNHDIRMDDLSTVPEQPIGVVLKSHNVTQLAGYDPEFNLIGVPYLDNPDDWNDYIDQTKINDQTLVCFHASIFPETEMPPYDAVSAESLAALLPEVRYIAYGHIHTPPRKGAYYRAGNAWFCNRGSISRGSLHGENLTRKPGITIFDSENPDEPFTSIEVPHRPAEEVFKIEEREMLEASRDRVKDFLETMGEVESGWLTKEQIKDHVLRTVGKDVEYLVDEIFDSVE